MSSGFPRPSFYREGGPSRMMNRQKIQSFSEDGKVLRSRTNSLKIKDRNASKHRHMSTETQYFIQKICYRKTASIDMTRHGFINDSKADPVNYVMKSLRTQLEKICVKPVGVKSNFSPVLPRAKLRDAVTSTERKPLCIPKSVKPVVVKRNFSPALPRTKPREPVTSTEQIPPCIPKSALTSPGTRPSRTGCRVRIQSEPNPGPKAGQKKVKLMSPNKNKGRTPSRKK